MLSFVPCTHNRNLRALVLAYEFLRFSGYAHLCWPVALGYPECGIDSAHQNRFSDEQIPAFYGDKRKVFMLRIRLSRLDTRTHLSSWMQTERSASF